jgi:tripartite-type tricarboxylate transporter receptor subunit TctC
LQAAVALVVLSIHPPTAVNAESWPARQITLIAAFAPNTTTDYAARRVAQGLTNALGQPVVVETRSGGGGVVASVAVAKSPPDGYTALMTTIGPAVLRPLIDRKVGYDAVADFTPIILVGDAPNVLAVGAKSRFASIQDVVAYAKQNPGKLTIGHSGPGTMGHLIALLFTAEAGIEANFIAYQGAPPILSDLAGGHIDLGSIAYGAGADTANILAVTTDTRPSFLPNVPTTKESGFSNVTGSTWSAIFGPTGLPPEILSRLNTEINAVIATPDARKQFDTVGYRVLGGSPERLRELMARDHAKWSKVIEAAKLVIEP